MAKKYTITEAAKALRVSRQGVHLAIKKGKLPATLGTTIQVVEALLIDEKDLKAYQVNPTRQRVGKKTI
jgi:excisionase family DNA binding protein